MKVKLYVWQRSSLCLLFSFLFHAMVFSQQVAKSIPNATSPDGLIGFLEFRPSDYGTQKHPLIIFLHGIGERGNGTSQINSVAANAIPKFCAAGATMRFTVGGVTSSFVVLSPQLSVQYGYWPTFYVREMIKYAKANLQIDTNRIYITGLSLGGGGTWRSITDASGFDYSFDAGIAAAAPVCGTQEETDADFGGTVGANHLPIWAFHCIDDGTVPVGATQHAEVLGSILGINNPAMKFTYYMYGGHGGAWTYAYDTGHITTLVSNGTNFTANPNLYEWLLAHTRATGNTAPLANAGANQAITLPVNSVTLTGSGNGTNGAIITTYSWAKVSGPASGTITTPASASTALTGLTAGTYQYSLTVTDNHGLNSSSSVLVTVSPAPNLPPVANAGSNSTITLPVNTATLNGTASNDPDGSISSYHWTKTSGPATFTIVNAASASTAVNNLVQGVYTFNLKVTDNNGATAKASVTVTVNAAAPPVNLPPVATAGSNSTITLPVNTATLNGTASNDPDGSISSYQWTKTSGPATFTIVNAASVSTAVNNLVQGVYTFNLQVTDNNGATANASVTVTVTAAPPPPVNQPPIAIAGTSTYITLPVNTVTLDGTASNDPDGSISSYQWTKTSGPTTFTIANATSASTQVNNLVQGVYTFNLKVTDNNGATANASVTVTVNAALPPPVNQPPVANAGSNAAITLPVTSFTLDGTVSADPDGSIVSYAWSQQSGPSPAGIVTPGAATTQVNGLVQGVYVFKLVVIDDKAASASATVSLTVNPVPNKAPVASAGYDISITLPDNTADLNGTASYDPDGSIAAFSWNKISGPGAITIVNSNTATPSVIGLVQGKYVFELTITDNQGAKASDQVSVTVNPIPNRPPVANAGKDTSIALPVNAIQLSGAASSDPDGSVTGYNWKQVSGPAPAIIASPATAATLISNLVEGDYIFELAVTDNAGAAATARVNVTVRNNFKFSQFYKLYPNPAKSTVNLQFIDDKTGKMVVRAYAADGRMVMNQTMNKDQSMVTTSLDVTSLKKGLYYLEVTQTDGTKLVRPFVKQ